ncbi:MAG: NUDIX domain-containing protein [bacterium]|nr:NUDIX domain-containing protein [bacterium]
MNKRVLQNVVVAGIIVADYKLLLLQRGADERVFPGLWELPSGKKEIGETTKEALKREILEETGLTVEPGSVVDVFDYKVEKPDEIRETVQINFMTKLVGKKHPSISKEHQNYAWVDKTDLVKFDLSNETRQVIERAFKM